MRVYLRAIADGSKKTEFRKNSRYYAELFQKRPTELLLHYQGKERLIVRVKAVRLIRRPKELDGYAFLNTRLVYAIDLGRIIKHVK